MFLACFKRQDDIESEFSLHTTHCRCTGAWIKRKRETGKGVKEEESCHRLLGEIIEMQAQTLGTGPIYIVERMGRAPNHSQMMGALPAA